MVFHSMLLWLQSVSSEPAMHEMLPSVSLISLSSLWSFVLAVSHRVCRGISVLSKTVLACIAMEEQSKDQKAKEEKLNIECFFHLMIYESTQRCLAGRYYCHHHHHHLSFTTRGCQSASTETEGLRTTTCPAKVRPFHTSHSEIQQCVSMIEDPQGSLCPFSCIAPAAFKSCSSAHKTPIIAFRHLLFFWK